MASDLWNKAAHGIERTSFAVDNQIQWCKLEEALNVVFQTETGRGLSDEHFLFLCKIYRFSSFLFLSSFSEKIKIFNITILCSSKSLWNEYCI